MPAMVAGGRDDLDLEGNWESLGTGGAGEAGGRGKGKPKKKRKASAAAEEAPAEDDDDASAEEPPKKKAKKARRKGAALAAAAAAVDASVAREEGPAAQARARLQAAWEAEVKASHLTQLEQKEVAPMASWFVPCGEDVALAVLPKRLPAGAWSSSLRTLLALRDRAKPPAATPHGVSIAVLASSAERVFAAITEIRDAKAWRGLKPLALAAHGGGRKRDQVARQAKALASGASLAVATPGRLLRLVEEGHVKPANLGALVVDLTRDQKQRNLLGMPETRRDLFSLLRKHLLPLLGRGDGPRLLLCGNTADTAA